LKSSNDFLIKILLDNVKRLQEYEKHTSGPINSLRIAFVADRPTVGLMSSRKRLAEENAQRNADAHALKQGADAKDLYHRNAMHLGNVKLRLPKIG
jgi:hypothetical protein